MSSMPTSDSNGNPRGSLSADGIRCVAGMLPFIGIVTRRMVGCGAAARSLALYIHLSDAGIREATGQWRNQNSVRLLAWL